MNPLSPNQIDQVDSKIKDKQGTWLHPISYIRRVPSDPWSSFNLRRERNLPVFVKLFFMTPFSYNICFLVYFLDTLLDYRDEYC